MGIEGAYLGYVYTFRVLSALFRCPAYNNIFNVNMTICYSANGSSWRGFNVTVYSLSLPYCASSIIPCIFVTKCNLGNNISDLLLLIVLDICGHDDVSPHYLNSCSNVAWNIFVYFCQWEQSYSNLLLIFCQCRRRTQSSAVINRR